MKILYNKILIVEEPKIGCYNNNNKKVNIIDLNDKTGQLLPSMEQLGPFLCGRSYHYCNRY